jgi:hypothetical protein
MLVQISVLVAYNHCVLLLLSTIEGANLNLGRKQKTRNCLCAVVTNIPGLENLFFWLGKMRSTKTLSVVLSQPSELSSVAY